MRRWLWVTRPDVWATIPGGALAHGGQYEWTCHEETRPRDVALLYRADAAKDVAHVFRVHSDPWEDDHFSKKGETDWWCECELVHTLKQPLQLWDMRQRKALDDWLPMQVGFHGTAFAVEPAHWRDLLDLAHPLDRIALRRFGGA